MRQRFIEQAEKLGNGAQFQALLDVLERYPLYNYLNPKYQGINFTLPQHRTTWVIWISPGLYAAYHLERVCSLSGLSSQDITQLLVPKDKLCNTIRFRLIRAEVGTHSGIDQKKE